MIIRRENDDLSNHVDFVVRRAVVKAALEYKIGHDPNYAHVIKDDELLEMLPEDGSVAHRLPTCRVGRQDGGTPEAAGPSDAAPQEPEVEEGQPAERERDVSGVLNLGGSQPTEVAAIRAGAERTIDGGNGPAAPVPNNIVSSTLTHLLLTATYCSTDPSSAN